MRRATRRGSMGGVAAVLGALLALGPAPGWAQPPLPFTLTAVGPGVYAAIDGPKGESGSNAGFVIGDDGVLVVDSFYSPDAARALLGEIRRLTPKPVRYVVNTHYHIDHVAGDQVFRDAGAILIAHRNARGWLRTENSHLFATLTPAQKTLIESLALPDVVTDTDLTVWLGARRVDIRAMKGHTGGDLVIGVPDAHALFCGDLLWRRVSPNIIDGTVRDWVATLAAFEAAPGAAGETFVPGHGDVAALPDVAQFHAYLTDLSAWTAQARAAGLSGDALAARVLEAMKARYGSWQAFGYFAPREIGFMNAELAGTKRVPVPAAP